MLKTRVIALALLFAISTPSGAFLNHSVLASPKDEPLPQYETRVFIKPNCVVRPKAGQEGFLVAIAAIFLPILIEKLLGAAGAALKKAGSDDTVRDTGKLPTYLYQYSKNASKNRLKLNPDFGCVIVVRGRFDKSNEAPPTAPSPSVVLLRNGGIRVRDVAMAYEGMVTIADDKTALRYESRYFEVNRFIGSNSSKPKSERRAVVLNLAITGVGAKEGEPLLSLAMVNLGEIESGTILGPDELTSKQSSWLGGLAISEASLKAIETMEISNNPAGVMPVTIEATIAETRDGNAALKFIGEVLEAAKQKAGETISSQILDPKDKAAEAASALEKLLQEEEAAYAELLGAESALAEFGPLGANPTPAKRAAYEVKRFKVITAGRAWCIKFEALTKLGHAPANRGGHKCPLDVPH